MSPPESDGKCEEEEDEGEDNQSSDQYHENSKKKKGAAKSLIEAINARREIDLTEVFILNITFQIDLTSN